MATTSRGNWTCDGHTDWKEIDGELVFVSLEMDIDSNKRHKKPCGKWQAIVSGMPSASCRANSQEEAWQAVEDKIRRKHNLWRLQEFHRRRNENRFLE